MTSNGHPSSPPSLAPNHAANEPSDDDAGDPAVSMTLENTFEEEEEEEEEDVQVPTISEDEIPKVMKGAKKGMLEDLHLILSLLENDSFPSKFTEEAFNIFVQHVKKPFVRKEPLKRKLVRFGLVSGSLKGFRLLGKLFFMNSDRAMSMARLWDDAFRWLNILIDAFLDGTHREGNPVVSVSAYTFIVFRDLQLAGLKHIFHNPEVFKFAFRLWKDDSSADNGWINSGSLPLAIMCSQMDLNVENRPFLDAAVEAYEEMGGEDGREGGIAHIAIRRLVAELQNEEYREGALCFQIETLWLFTKDNDQYGNKKALGKSDLGLASVTHAFAKLAEADMLWINRTTTATRAVHLLESHLCTHRSFDAVQMADVLRYGLLAGMHNFVRHFEWLDNKEALLNILDRLLDLLSIPSVLETAVEGLRGVRSNTEPDRLSNDTRTFATRLSKTRNVILERTIMQRLYKVVGREELGYCANKSCHRVGPRSSFKKCASCHFALFCSPACQSSSWSEHHKLCALLTYDDRSIRRGRVLMTGPRDRLPRKIATFELYRLLPNLVELINRSQSEQIPTSRIGFEVDVSAFPTRINAFDVTSFARRDDLPQGLHRFGGICTELLGDARNWQCDYQATLLKVRHQDNTFVCVVPLRKSAFAPRDAKDNLVVLNGAGNAPNGVFTCQDRYGRPLIPCEGDEVREMARHIQREADATKDSESPVDMWDGDFMDSVIERFLKGDYDDNAT